MISYLSAVLVLFGLAIQLASLVPLRKMIAMLPAGSVRNKWLGMTALILVFIAGYLAYTLIFWGQQSALADILIPCIFLFGAVFVWLTIELSLQTATDLLQMHVLEVESITDPLTNVYNRRYLDRRLDDEVERSKRYSLPLTVLMIDIDYFKRVNDTYGHQAGDAILSTFSGLTRNSLRDLDLVARYGGEEFLVICTNTTVDGAALVGERLRQVVESHPFEVAGESGKRQNLQITISVGAAGLAQSLDGKEKLVEAADQALCRAKAEGRNRVIVAKTEAMGSEKSK